MLADSNGIISSQHMHWFFEAEGSRECAPLLLSFPCVAACVFVTVCAHCRCTRRYDDENKLAQLMRKLDTNGDGVVRRVTVAVACDCCCCAR